MCSSTWRTQASKFTLKSSTHVDKALIDSSTLFDVQRSLQKPTASWAQNTLRNLLVYRRHHPQLTISGLTVFELLEGLYRSGDRQVITEFHENLLPRYEVLHTDTSIEDKAAQIHAKLRLARQGIGMADTMIAATAITHNLILVNANTRHFPRVVEAGSPLKLVNWRVA